ncbi:NADH dehydrogenase, alpha subcomplex, subunit 6 [Aureobasidium pullulans]|uniref:NADH dehydrogenase, alpha subcomplex, subunit 6 n=1 Tax=Aureobasidium pullulans TaxID=5580 RepID=A0A4V4IJW9_AURPU|nr:NADH dehydrogenase, alpha subcomplex, subunit 6 [Aureobasidium pullulans]THX37104.1 NADH dehydrogenase, alpha subcomplex, subunit 6 [Aureobasidium pullulans]THY48189.1 NADH dehydrogenase, alpha subcomplex, subunit 6 [Aureobasidium pullulans]
MINPTYLAQRTRSSVNWNDAQKRVLKSYREWVRAAPEIQQMYSLNMPVSAIRTKMRQEFERHRYVQQLKTVDVLLFNSHQEYQETLNFWKQLTHVLKYFRAEEDPKAALPKNFIQGFLEVRNAPHQHHMPISCIDSTFRDATRQQNNHAPFDFPGLPVMIPL